MENMQDKCLMDDMLTCEKHAALNYSMFANECATESVRADVFALMNDQHKLQSEIFDFMSSRGWYTTEAAEMQKINKAKQKFQNAQ